MQSVAPTPVCKLIGVHNMKPMILPSLNAHERFKHAKARLGTFVSQVANEFVKIGGESKSHKKNKSYALNNNTDDNGDDRIGHGDDKLLMANLCTSPVLRQQTLGILDTT